MWWILLRRILFAAEWPPGGLKCAQDYKHLLPESRSQLPCWPLCRRCIHKPWVKSRKNVRRWEPVCRLHSHRSSRSAWAEITRTGRKLWPTVHRSLPHLWADTPPCKMGWSCPSRGVGGEDPESWHVEFRAPSWLPVMGGSVSLSWLSEKVRLQKCPCSIIVSGMGERVIQIHLKVIIYCPWTKLWLHFWTHKEKFRRGEGWREEWRNTCVFGGDAAAALNFTEQVVAHVCLWLDRIVSIASLASDLHCLW